MEVRLTAGVRLAERRDERMHGIDPLKPNVRSSQIGRRGSRLRRSVEVADEPGPTGYPHGQRGKAGVLPISVLRHDPGDHDRQDECHQLPIGEDLK